MAILNIVKEGDPVLRKVCRPVTEITPRTIQLLEDMKETLHKADGCGLAAPQVGVLRRIALVEVEKGKLVGERFLTFATRKILPVRVDISACKTHFDLQKTVLTTMLGPPISPYATRRNVLILNGNAS